MKRVLSFSDDTLKMEEIDESGKVVSEKLFTAFSSAQINTTKLHVRIYPRNGDQITVTFDEIRPQWTTTTTYIALYAETWFTLVDVTDIISVTSYYNKIVIAYTANTASEFVFPPTETEQISKLARWFALAFPHRNWNLTLLFFCPREPKYLQIARPLFEDFNTAIALIHSAKILHVLLNVVSPFNDDDAAVRNIEKNFR